MDTNSEVLEVEKITLTDTEKEAFGSAMFEDYKKPDSVVEDEVTESAAGEKEEEVIEESVIEQPEIIEEATDGGEQEEVIEDRIVGLKPKVEADSVKDTKVDEPKTKESVEPKKVSKTIEFKNDLQKILHNALQSDEDVSVKEIEALYKKGYEKLSDLDIIRYGISTNPAYKNVSQATINNLVEERLEEIQKRLDLDDPNDLQIFNEKIGIEAQKIKGDLESRRNELISKYAVDVNIEVDAPENQVVEQEMTPEEIAAIRDGHIAEALELIEKELTDSFVTVEDKEGPIHIPIENKTLLAEALIDPVGFVTKNSMTNGAFDIKKFAKWMNYGANMEAHDNEVIKSGIAIGKKSVVKEVKNQQNPKSREQTGLGGKKPLDNINEFAAAMANSKFN